MKKLLEDIRKFNKERNWGKFHTPENLAKSICIESAELLENFQWGQDWDNKVNVKEELADILTYCLLMCDKLNLDPNKIILDKMKKNIIKYPTGKEKLKNE